MDYVNIVFDGPPGPEAPRFVEAEDPTGKSLNFGEWVQRPDGYWALRVPAVGSGSLTLTHSPSPLAPGERKEVYCEDCHSFQSMVEHAPQLTARNEYPWYDITCARCTGIIATVRILPKPAG